MSDEATTILHANATDDANADKPAAAAASVLGAATQRNSKRAAALEKARKASAASRKAKAAQKRQTVEAQVDDPVSAAVKKELLAAPVTSAKDLAKLIASVEESLAAVAPIAGPKGVFLVRALQWSDGKGRPTPQCEMACGFMWPWLKKKDVFGALAASADGLMFATGCVLLLGPFIATIVQLFFPQPRLRVIETPHVEQPAAPVTENGASGSVTAPVAVQ